MGSLSAPDPPGRGRRKTDPRRSVRQAHGARVSRSPHDFRDERPLRPVGVHHADVPSSSRSTSHPLHACTRSGGRPVTTPSAQCTGSSTASGSSPDTETATGPESPNPQLNASPARPIVWPLAASPVRPSVPPVPGTFPRGIPSIRISNPSGSGAVVAPPPDTTTVTSIAPTLRTTTRCGGLSRRCPPRPGRARRASGPRSTPSRCPTPARMAPPCPPRRSGAR